MDPSLDMVGAVRASLELSFPFVTSLHTLGNLAEKIGAIDLKNQ